MKILFLSAASSAHTVRWVNALSERGHEVVLVSQKDHKEGADDISERVKVFYLPFDGAKGYYLNAFSLHRFYRREKFDVINVHYASGYGTLARMAELPNIILNVWGSDVYDFPYQSKIKEKILRKNLGHASYLASTSYSMAEQTKRFLAEKKEIEVTPFGVDIQRFAPNSVMKKEEFVFGIVKTLSYKYGIDMVIEAFDIFLRQITDDKKSLIKLYIYGQGELEDSLKRLVDTKNLQEQIYFGGYIENSRVPEALSKIDVFLLGSRMQSESFGVAAVEAMACELPVIATRVSGFEEVIKDGETGFLVSVDDANAMSGYMLKLYEDEELRKKLGKAGRARVESLYNWDENVDKMIDMYERIRK